jgi:hypothetical protein
MRKLKKIPKNKKTAQESDTSVEEALVKRKKIRVSKRKRKTRKRITTNPKIHKYPKQRCAYIDPKSGKQCTAWAVGKGTTCRRHGGDPVVKENLRTDRELEEMRSLQIKFNPAVHPMAYITMSREGYSDTEIAAEFGVSKAALQDWSEKYDSFYNAHAIGKEMQEAWWLRIGKDNLENKRNFNTGLYKFMTMNQLGYSDKVEQKSTSTHLHGVLMIPDAVTEEEWEEDVIDV